jgi:hypothetical protein
MANAFTRDAFGDATKIALKDEESSAESWIEV